MDQQIVDGWRQLLQGNKVIFTSLTAGDILQVAELIKGTIQPPVTIEEPTEEESNDDTV